MTEPFRDQELTPGTEIDAGPSMPAAPPAQLVRAGGAESVRRETPAPIVILSAAKRLALIECHIAGTVHKLRGFWGGEARTARIAGVTVSDLVRDGMMVVNELGYRRSAARLTDRGAWFARTLALQFPA